MGGLFGFGEGVTRMGTHSWKIRLNTVLNSCGRRGAQTANAFGLLAMFYSGIEGGLDYVDFERCA